MEEREERDGGGREGGMEEWKEVWMEGCGEGGMEEWKEVWMEGWREEEREEGGRMEEEIGGLGVVKEGVGMARES